MKIEDFYSEIADIKGEPQYIDGVPFAPIKLFDGRTSTLLRILFAKDKMELIDEKKMEFEGVRKSYKASFLKSLLYYYACSNEHGYYYVLSLLKEFFITICQIKNADEGSGVGLICNTNIKHPLEIFDSPVFIIIKYNDNALKIDENMFDVVRECVLKQNGISLKSIEGYRADMEELKKSSVADKKSMSFSDEIFSFLAMSGMNMYSEGFQNYTIYQFKYHFNYLQQYIDYKTLYPLQASGQVKFGNKIKYYLEPLNFNKGRYDDLLITGDDFAQTGIAKSIDGFTLPDKK